MVDEPKEEKLICAPQPLDGRSSATNDPVLATITDSRSSVSIEHFLLELRIKLLVHCFYKIATSLLLSARR